MEEKVENNNFKMMSKDVQEYGVNEAVFDFAVKMVAKDYVDVGDIPEELRNDDKFMISVYKNNKEALEYIGEELANDPIFMEKLANEDIHVLKYAGEKLLHDYTFMQTLAQKDIKVLEYADEYLLDDEGFVLDMAKHSLDTLNYVEHDLKTNWHFIDNGRKELKEYYKQQKEQFERESQLDGFNIDIAKVYSESINKIDEYFDDLEEMVSCKVVPSNAKMVDAESTREELVEELIQTREKADKYRELFQKAQELLREYTQLSDQEKETDKEFVDNQGVDDIER